MIVEYHLAAITASDEGTAKDIIRKSKKESFSKLAKEYSMDPSAVKGGDLGWVNPSQLQGSIKQAISTIPTGGTSNTPIPSGKVWYVLHVINKREGKPAPFEQSKDRLQQVVLQNLKANYIEQLRQSQLKSKAQQ